MENEVNILNENDTESTDSNEPNESGSAPEDDVIINVQNENINSNETSQTEAIVESSNFDLNLPASHSYLGTNFEELRGRTILDEGIYVNLPLLIEESIVLFPGQTLPMVVSQQNVIDMLTKCIQKNRTFGVVCLQEDKLEPIGTTAEIYEYVQGSPEERCRIKAKGRQRFQILRMIQGYNEISANVKIVPEITLSHPIFGRRPSSLDRWKMKPTNEQEQKRHEKVERIEASLTFWPAWIYRQYDPHRLAFKIRQHLAFIETKGSCIPTDPTDLSFWVAQNLPLTDRERVMLLKYDCAIPRLQWELKYLTKDRIIVCGQCEMNIGNQSDIFPMSKEGPQSTFCNAGGIIHDTVTLYKAKNIELSGQPPSSVYSWFPGYAWRCATCEGCGTFIGWQFTSTDKTLRPASFWGLRRKSLKSKKIDKHIKESSYSNNSERCQSDSEDDYEYYNSYATN